MKATLLLADFAQATDGKASALGSGWAVTGTPTPPMALIAYIDCPWDQTNKKHHMEIDLVDADGHAVSFENGPLGQPVPALHIEADLEVGRPPGVPAGTPLRQVISLAIGPGMPLVAGQKYEFRLTVDGTPMDSWLSTFMVQGA